jgi:hypothetical protein
MHGPWCVTVALLVLAAGACRRSTPQPSAPDAGRCRRPRGPPTPAGAHRGQARRLPAYETAAPGSRAPSARRFVAWRRLRRGRAALEEAYAGLQRRTERAQAVRADAGSPRSRYRRWRRSPPRWRWPGRRGRTGTEEALRRWSGEGSAPPGAASGVERTVARLREQQERARSLSEFVPRGDAAVDVVWPGERQCSSLGRAALTGSCRRPSGLVG